jgi:hypothetical protein
MQVRHWSLAAALHHGASLHLALRFKYLQRLAPTHQLRAKPHFWCLLQVGVVVVAVEQLAAVGVALAQQ